MLWICERSKPIIRNAEAKCLSAVKIVAQFQADTGSLKLSEFSFQIDSMLQIGSPRRKGRRSSTGFS